MKTDKALLLMAAKACQLNVEVIIIDSDDNIDGLIVVEKNTKNNTKWSPLLDDGDALRLAVKLQLDFYVDGKQAGCWINNLVCLVEDINGDTYAATRRAIVRAAAAIGEQL